MLQGAKTTKSNRTEPIPATYLASIAGHEETEAISVCPKRIPLRSGEELRRTAFAFLIVNFPSSNLTLH